MPKGIPLTEEELQRRRKEIFNASVHLFLEKGFNETSMREIAKAAGVGKSTLYDYFKSKEEIIISYFEDQIQVMTQRAYEITQQEISVAEKLRQISQIHMEYLVTNKQIFLRMSFEVQRLSLESQEFVQKQRHGYQDMIRGLVEEGVQREEFRPVNPLLAARTLLTVLSLAIYTSRPTGTPEQMLEDALAIFFNGIQG